MQCVKCGKELKNDAAFCDKCGAPQNRCVNCGNEMKTDAAFCDKCGTSRKGNAIPQESTPLCIKCGIGLLPGSLFCDMCGASQKANPVAAANCSTNPNGVQTPCNTAAAQTARHPAQTAPEMQISSKSRFTYIILCLFFGGIGIHNFYAGRTGAGIAQLLLSWTGISSLWAFIELFAVSNDGQGRKMVVPALSQAGVNIFAIISLFAGIIAIVVRMFLIPPEYYNSELQVLLVGVLPYVLPGVISAISGIIALWGNSRIKILAVIGICLDFLYTTVMFLIDVISRV